MAEKNLIIIIGNGFDIAHGLPTKYSDFADYFIRILSTLLIEFYNDEEVSSHLFSDDLIKILNSNSSSDSTFSLLFSLIKNNWRTDIKIMHSS